MLNKKEKAKIQACAGCVCFNLRMAARVITQVYDKALKPTGIRATQFPILAVLAMNGPDSISSLSRFMAMNRTTLTRNLKPIEKLGFIRIENGVDKRSKTVALTEKGEAIIKEILPIWDKVQKQVLRTMGADRWKYMLENLQTIPSLFH